MTLSPRSLSRLAEVHPDLQLVISRADQLGEMDFIVTEGMRTLDKQKQLKAKGASQTLKSRHLTGHAVDLAVLVDGEVRWDWPLYTKLGALVKEAAKIEGVHVEWGGDWLKFKDGPHFQLPWKDYP